VRLLIDEDLSPKLTAIAHEAGYEATCVRDRGRLRSRDVEVARLALSEERVLVTNNIVDFLDLALEAGVHPGLILYNWGPWRRRGHGSQRGCVTSMPGTSKRRAARQSS
jgi:predicted nuclease of predicted toxin-antitoxin system